MINFKLDRTSFKPQSIVDAANHKSYYLKMTWQERLSVTYYLNSVAYNYNPNNPPKMNRNHFSAKSLSHNG
jgi:hypothetical protein